MASCDNCRFVRDRQIFTVPADKSLTGAPIDVKQGWCHRAPPSMWGEGRSSSFPTTSLTEWCGEHRWSIAGLFRAIGAIFRRK